MAHLECIVIMVRFAPWMAILEAWLDLEVEHWSCHLFPFPVEDVVRVDMIAYNLERGGGVGKHWVQYNLHSECEVSIRFMWRALSTTCCMSSALVCTPPPLPSSPSLLPTLPISATT